MRKFTAVYCNADDDVPLYTVLGPIPTRPTLPACLPVYSSSAWLIAGSNNEIVSRLMMGAGERHGGEKVKWVDRCSGAGVIKSEGSDKSSHSELVLPNV